MHIDIKPEDVDALVRDSILKAGLGKVIERAIAEVPKVDSYNNPITEALRKYIAKVTVEVAMKKMIDAAAENRY